jgi:3-dehydroquinate synthase
MSQSPETAAPVSQVLSQRFSVGFEYPVVFTRDSLNPSNHALLSAICRREPARRHRLLAVLDSGVADTHPQLRARIASYCETHGSSLHLLAEPLIVPGGEAVKQSSEWVSDLHARMHALRIDRHSFVVVFGGGAVLDAVGYAAATTHRGVRVVRLPTTVLAQNDAGIGVKNGINAFGAKNFLGSFAPPFAVVNDADFLLTLPERDRRAGMAEAVKVALIRDATFFAWLVEQSDALRRFVPDAVEYLIRRAAEIHLRQICEGGDPFELGSARPLDFGHWAAHKLESLSHGRVRHGEAVAIGMALDTRYSVEVGLLNERDGAAIVGLLRALGFKLWDAQLETATDSGNPALLAGLDEFREHLGGELTITLLSGIGRALEVHAMDEAKVLRALHWLKTEDARCT